MVNFSDQFRLVLEGMDLKALPLHHRLLKAYAFNAYGRPALLVEVNAKFESAVDGTKGIEVSLDPPGTHNRYLRFQSEEAGLSPMFEAVVTSILESSLAAESEEDALDRLLVSFEEFRIMFATRGGRLGESEIRGLFAELLMLLELRADGWEPMAAITAWQGPYRVAKDFVLPNKRSMEIKSMRRTNHRVRIASIDQLDPRDEDLRLAVMVLERSAPADGRGLIDLVEDIRVWMSEDFTAALKFTAALSALGIDLSDAHYQQWAFASDEWLWFTVGEEFPRIRRDSAPAAISRVSFTLDTDQIKEFATDAFWTKGD